MRANEYYPGQAVRISAAFTDIAQTATDPSAITISVKNPSDTITAYVYGVDVELVKDGVGLYHLDFTPDVAGTWYYRVESTGPVTAATEGSIVARETSF